MKLIYLTLWILQSVIWQRFLSKLLIIKNSLSEKTKKKKNFIIKRYLCKTIPQRPILNSNFLLYHKIRNTTRLESSCTRVKKVLISMQGSDGRANRTILIAILNRVANVSYRVLQPVNTASFA